MAEPPYRPLDAQVIPRFAGIRTFMRAPHVTELAGVDAVVYGIPFDTATSYRSGPRFGRWTFRARLNSIHNSSSHTGLSIRGYIIQRNTPIWISRSRIQSVAGRSTRSHLSHSSRPRLDLRRRLRLRLQLRLHRKLRLHLQVSLHRKLHRHLQLHPALEAERKSGLRFLQGSGYSNKRSNESRQICDHVSMTSRRASNSSFARNVRPVIIASRFSTFGSASLKT